MTTVLIDNRSGEELDLSLLKEVESYIERTLRSEKVIAATEISLSFVTPAEIKELNSEYRSKDEVTDVLSFPMFNFPEDGHLLMEEQQNPILLGDIVICVERAREQAREFGQSVIAEIAYLCVHSVLHLLGYDHLEETDKKEMRSHEKAVVGEGQVLP